MTEIPLSLLMHLYSDDPLPTVADGLGFSPAQWEPGDIFIQFHDFGTVSARFLETGLYDYTTGERLPLEIGDAEATTVQIHAR